MGKHGFGELYKMQSIITYRCSNLELRPFAGAISHGVKRTVRRMTESFPYVVPPLAFGALVWIGADALSLKYARKNPDDYKNNQ